MQQVEIIIKGLRSGYEIEHLTRIFYPKAALRQTKTTKGNLVYARANGNTLCAGVRLNGKVFIKRAACKNAGEDDEFGGNLQGRKSQLAKLLYSLLCDVTGMRPPWGMLTGVRPVRLLRRNCQKFGYEKAKKVFLNYFDVSKEKFMLTSSVVKAQEPLLCKMNKMGYSLYISIPFCPSRCSYCSFVSRTTENEAGQIEAYLEKLFCELKQVASIAKHNNLVLENIYIGGGTPTSLTENQLKHLLEAVQTYYDVGRVLEYTVEAGRPDCTSKEKLSLLKSFGVSRISINPQTMNDDVLREIGRRHTAQDVRDCFKTARSEGHNCINMDLIAGLPCDDTQSFLKTLDEIIFLRPENITVHTLTLKRASNIVIEQKTANSSPMEMMAKAAPRLLNAGYLPYYLYRQKNTVDNLENIGFALPNTQSAYNICIMEEVSTILAVGAGAVTKLVKNRGEDIVRIYNHKYPVDYIANFDEIINKKKQGVSDFYGSDVDSEKTG